jgi:FkbM family methyltransferase
MRTKVIKKLLGQQSLRILRLLGVFQFIKFTLYKLTKKKYSLTYNNITIHFRPWVKSDISGILGFINHRDNNYLNDIKNLTENKYSSKTISFFDLGSNIGLDSLASFIVFRNLRSLNVVEMDSDNIEIAKLNVEQFNLEEISYINKAIWIDSETIVKYSIDKEPNAFSIIGEKKSGTYKQCETITMEELVFKSDIEKNLVILKMDIEGVEKRIFEKADNYWINKLDYFYIEYHEYNENDRNCLIEIVRQNGLEIIKEYDYWNFDGWGGILFGKSKNWVEI